MSATDPFPLPSGTESGKDFSIKPGDNFYDYCNGTWLKNTPIPVAGNWDVTFLCNAGSYGYYWSSSLSTDDPYNEWDLDCTQATLLCKAV